ncbi:peptidyl-prolyl cis-trans isomerase [Labilibaculum euxinus]|uniref:Peptidyl-prolyl cis-trans isomerase n=1 Tax=Labilibaculum euxinus TaxID=2686357 RepID=A0A7M4D4C6_9BACT|nr:peptidyl-prolyl cis-trans isomerase [Labilibaculum euxinus]MUP37505.1 peptidyl-prolyl cis-trans isomerase [Labilibaculum euxinus]MVB06710.1 peptidyl-prolyl cis-trans isomerase [Labilibaculum euxinus]
MTKYSLLLLLFVILYSCNSNKSENDKPVAKVNDNILYLSTVKEVIPNGISKDDSLLIAQNYTHQWIKKQLIISKAELNLSEEDKDVSKMVEDYRSSLIIHKYQQQLIEQKIDTLISQFEIENYYRSYSANFILNRNILKALYIKIPIPVPNLSKIQKLYKSEKEDDWAELEDYCFQNATKFDNFSDRWIYAQELLDKLPGNINDEVKFLKHRKYYETSDSTHHYFVKIQEFELKDNLAPLPFVKEDIKKILLNKRKIQFIKNLEENIYRDAESKNKFKIY